MNPFIRPKIADLTSHSPSKVNIIQTGPACLAVVLALALLGVARAAGPSTANAMPTNCMSLVPAIELQIEPEGDAGGSGPLALRVRVRAVEPAVSSAVVRLELPPGLRFAAERFDRPEMSALVVAGEDGHTFLTLNVELDDSGAADVALPVSQGVVPILADRVVEARAIPRVEDGASGTGTAIAVAHLELAGGASARRRDSALDAANSPLS